MRRHCVGGKELGPGGGGDVLFSVSPRARNGHEVGGKFLLENLELLVGGLCRDAGESPVWHLGPDGLGRDSVRHS
jgi:hypothetical protein